MRNLFSNKWIYYIEKHRVLNSEIKMTFFTHGGFSIKLLVVYLHIINECLSYKFFPYSILTGHTKVEYVAYWVLKTCETRNFVHIQKIKMFLDFVTSILASMILGVTTLVICTEFLQQPISREEIASDAVHAPGFRELSQETGWKKTGWKKRADEVRTSTEKQEQGKEEIQKFVLRTLAQELNTYLLKYLY
jgi:hypothetical protein